MAVVNGAATSLASQFTNGNKSPFNSDDENRLHSQLTRTALVSTAKILSRSDPTSGTVTYTLQIGNVKIPSVSAFEIFDYISPYELEVFENASFKSEIAAQELAAKTRTEEPRKGPGRPKREVQTSESDDSRDTRGEDSNGPTTLLGGRRPRPNYTHFYPKQRAKRGGGRGGSVQVVIESKNQGGFVRPDIPASNAESSASSRPERQHKRQKRESSSAAESVYSIASLHVPTQQSSLVKAAGRVSSKVPESPKDVEIIEASLDAHSRGLSSATAKAKPSGSPTEVDLIESSLKASSKNKLSESPTDGEMIEASLATSSSTKDKGKGKARARVSLSESPMNVDETPATAPSTRRPTESKAKASLSSKSSTGQTLNSRQTRDDNKSATEPKGKILARLSAMISDPASAKPTASFSKAKARLSEISSASGSKAGASSVSKPISLPTGTPKLTAPTPGSKAGASSVSKPVSLPTGTPKPTASTPRAAFEAALKSNTKVKSSQQAFPRTVSKTPAASVSRVRASKAPLYSSTKAPVPSSSKASVASSSSSKATVASSLKASVVPSSKAPTAASKPIPPPSKPLHSTKAIAIDSSSSSSSSSSTTTTSSSDTDSEDEQNADEEAYTVERILKHCLSDPRTHTTYGALPVWLFQVKWQGYEEVTWEPVQSFEDEGVLEEYWGRTLNGIRGERYK